LNKVNRRQRGLIEAIAEGLRPPGLQAKLDELESRKAALEAGLATAPPAAPRLQPNLAEIYRPKVADLQVVGPHHPDRSVRDPHRARGPVPVEKGFEIEFVGEIVEDSPMSSTLGRRVPGWSSSEAMLAGQPTLTIQCQPPKYSVVSPALGLSTHIDFVAALAAVDQQGLASARREVVCHGAARGIY
jgi:hypothetical protein